MDEELENYINNHGHDHNAEIADAREAMDIRDDFDRQGY